MGALPMWGRVLIWLGVALACAAGVRWVVGSYEAWRDNIATTNYQAGDKAGAARVQGEWDEDRAQAQAALLERARQASLETERRLKAQEANQREQNRQLEATRRDAERAQRAADGLQLRAAAYLDAAGCSARSGDSALECIRQTVAQITDALGQCGGIARQVAAEADDARARGLKCEADYESLTLKATPP